MSHGSAITRLREAIWSLHETVERGSPFALQTVSLTTRTQYAAFLEVLYGFIAPFEEQLETYLEKMPDGPDAPARPGASRRFARRGLLRADLAALGLSEARITALPRCAAIPPLTSPQQAMGHLYLLEGSRLGGKVIAARVGQSLGLAESSGLAYFAGGGDAAPHWSAFKADVEAMATPESEAAMAQAARACFLSLQAWFAASAS